jgi:Ser/Thr protein kinase RdoA (MazF antagonist)
LSAPVAAGLFALLARLPPAGGLCHRDPNPGNVILITDGPRLIDRIGARRAQAAFDLAADQVILTKGAPHLADDPERPRAIHTGLPPAYAALAGTSESRAGVVGGALISPLCGL